MRNFKLSALFSICLFSFTVLSAQVKKEVAPPVRCGTETMLENLFNENPAFRAEYLRKSAATSRTSSPNGTSRLATLTAPVVIPVIVHVVLPNPNVITEEQIDFLLNRLNLDYSGLNADSTNGVLFYPVRGHSLIRFTRARRTPGANPVLTNGIERRVGAGPIAGTTYQAIKHTSAGGLDPWDVTQYYNIWVGDGGASGLLGIAPAIGVGAATEVNPVPAGQAGIDGVCVDYRGFSNGCFSYPQFAGGRTVVHEIGHNFGLFHTFTGCADGADFGQPTVTAQTLPANLVGPSPADDTPGQNAPTSGCPMGAVASTGCAATPNPPGKMYQNYMDYTDDPCYSMFTKNQVERMHYMLETYRPGYLTTQGANPPAGTPLLDAGINAIVSPGGSEFNNASCTITNYPTPNCPGTFIPRVSVINYGANTITTIRASVTVNGNAVTQDFTVNLITNRIATLSFTTAQPLVLGTNTISFTIISVNGVADGNATNNTISTTVNVVVSALPFTQDFVTTTFPPPNMTVVNAANNTWIRNANGNGNAGSAFIDNYLNNFPGQTDDLRTLPFSPPTNITPQDSVIISFDVAHRNYPGFNDVLSVLVSNNCGTTFTTVYSKGGATLATAASSTGAYTAPLASEWRRERISIGGAFLTGGPIIVAFRNTNDYGNNIFIDNINIDRKYDRDLRLSAIVSPASNLCTNTFTPQVTVTNNGALPIDSFRVGYSVNNGANVFQRFVQLINPGATVTLNLSAATVAQVNNTIRVFTADPARSGIVGDQQRSNDTLSKAFTAPASLPLVEGFETTPFPPSGWSIVGGAGVYTWVRDNHGRNSSWSAKVDNYNNNVVGQTVSLQTPPLRTTDIDSVIVTFDVAYRQYDATSVDGLQVLASRDCGTTFTSYYNKAGAVLATAGPTTADYLNPTQQQWRTERVSIPFTALNSGAAIIRFQNINDYGNNLFIDNINIVGIYKRDAQLLSINQPANVICTPANTPSVTIRNVGTDTIKAFKVAYILDNATPVITNFPTVNILRNTNLTVPLTPLNATVGTHTFRVYVYDLVTNSGSGDQRTQNDTLSKTFAVVSSVAAPLAEGFESSTFPPAGWALYNADGATTWQRTTTAARLGNASAYVNNYNYPNNGSRDELYTPQLTYSGVDSVSLSFDVAALTYSYPGSTAIPLDTLEVLATSDCGATLTSIYKKWGSELQTISDPNFPQTTEFIPTSRSQWRTERIDLSAFANRSSLQVVFRNTTNFENNIFLDNVNLSTKTLPAKLKEQGYLIFPTPFTTSFTIQHYVTPTELRGIAVYNSVGQRMYAQTFGANGATSLIPVDMSRFASGLYTVVLRYTNRTISQKIIKSR